MDKEKKYNSHSVESLLHKEWHFLLIIIFLMFGVSIIAACFKPETAKFTFPVVTGLTGFFTGKNNRK